MTPQQRNFHTVFEKKTKLPTAVCGVTSGVVLSQPSFPASSLLDYKHLRSSRPTFKL